MNILQDIQAAVLEKNPDLSTVLLKLRFLASRLGSEPLEDWVKFEAEGYPDDAEVPDYRTIGVSYSSTWVGPYNSGVNNAPIPLHLIDQYAGKNWTSHRMRQSIASVQEMAKVQKTLGIDASNLILLLQGKMYKGYSCISVTGTISPIGMHEILQSVRSRILELTIEFERRVPQAAEVTLTASLTKSSDNAGMVTQIFNQTVYGNVTHVNASGNAHVNLQVSAGDKDSLQGELIKAGLPANAAKEITEIIASSSTTDAKRPLNKKAMDWVKATVPKVAGGAWTMGSPIVTELLKEAALKYYGLR